MRIGMISLGCPKNLVDGEVMLGLAESHGHEVTADPSQADVLVVNTCAFIDRAKQESIDAILEMGEIKKKAAGRRLVVTGCLAERYRAELQQEMPEIDAVLGTGEVARIVDVLEGDAAPQARSEHLPSAPMTFYRRKSGSVASPSDAPSEPIGRDPRDRGSSAATRSPSTSLRTGAGVNAVPPSYATRPARRSAQPFERDDARVAPASPVFGLDLSTYLYDAETPRRLSTPGHYAYLKIAEGCDYTCGFCIIPKMRGHYRSRPADGVVREAQRLAANGVKELLLISQDTTFYGNDRGERQALAPLLRRLNAIDDLVWIRLLYLYPTTISDTIVDAIADSAKVCRYIDLPLQHASDPVLRRMRRPGTRANYERLLGRLRDRLPGVALRTTFIVGYPGETEADIETLLDFVRAVEFDHIGVFTYSAEEGTSAHLLPDDVPGKVKAQRRAAVMREQQRIIKRRLRGRLGQRAQVMLDGPDSEHPLVWQARLPGQAPDIDSRVYLTEADTDALTPGQLLDVELTEARGYDLIARPRARPTGA